MLRIDLGRLFTAIEEHAGEPECNGFLNRQTGEILFVYESEGNAPDTETAVVSVLDRAIIEASPDLWIKIPKYDPWFDGRNQQEEFCNEFLRKHGLNAVLR